VLPATRSTAKRSSTKHPLPTTQTNYAGPARTKFVFTDCAAILTEMLSLFRVATPLISQSCPQVSLRSCIIAYDRVLRGMPKTMMMAQCFVRRHIVWKRALVASAAGHIKFNQLTRGDMELMSFDGACTQASLRLPSWLSLPTLASQVNCSVELLYIGCRCGRQL